MNELVKLTEGGWLLTKEAAAQIASFEAQIKLAKEREEALKGAIIEAMEANGILRLDSDILSITYVAPTTRESLDSKALRKDFPEVYDAYAKLSPVKASVRIKVKRWTPTRSRGIRLSTLTTDISILLMALSSRALRKS